MKVENIKLYLALTLVSLATTRCSTPQESIDLKLAKSYFTELDSLCNADNGKLWGINLYGPTMMVDPQSRLIVANQPDNDNKLIEKNGLFIGYLPEKYNIANTSFDWSGKKWTMAMWNALPSNDAYQRNQLLIHESWHRVQNEIGIKPLMPANAHLDGLKGTILLKLELMALKQALQANLPLNKKKHLTNALTIRNYRQSLFPDNVENEFELHEGMAEYTGFKLCGLDNNLLPNIIAKKIEMSMDKDGLANSFAYLTGPAYGFLFDELKIEWIKDILQGKSLPEIGVAKADNKISADTAIIKSNVLEIINEYKSEQLIKEETEKFEFQKRLIELYKHKLVNGNQLIIQNNNLNFTYNPQEKLIPIDSIGVVYKTMRITGEWGILEVSNGILRSNDWQIFIVSTPLSAKTGTIIETDYKLTLNNDWGVVLIKDGKYSLQRKKHSK